MKRPARKIVEAVRGVGSPPGPGYAGWLRGYRLVIDGVTIHDDLDARFDDDSLRVLEIIRPAL